MKITNICYEHLRIESEIIHLYYLLSDEAISFSPCDSNLLLESQFSAFFTLQGHVTRSRDLKGIGMVGGERKMVWWLKLCQALNKKIVHLCH